MRRWQSAGIISAVTIFSPPSFTRCCSPSAASNPFLHLSSVNHNEDSTHHPLSSSSQKLIKNEKKETPKSNSSNTQRGGKPAEKKSSNMRLLEEIDTQIAALSHRKASLLKEVRMKQQRDRSSLLHVQQLIRLAEDPKALILSRLAEMTRKHSTVERAIAAAATTTAGVVSSCKKGAATSTRCSSPHVKQKQPRTDNSSHMMKEKKVCMPPLTPESMFYSSCKNSSTAGITTRYACLSPDEKRPYIVAAIRNKDIVTQVGELIEKGSTNISFEVDRLIDGFTWHV